MALAVAALTSLSPPLNVIHLESFFSQMLGTVFIPVLIYVLARYEATRPVKAIIFAGLVIAFSISMYFPKFILVIVVISAMMLTASLWQRASWKAPAVYTSAILTGVLLVEVFVGAVR